MIIGITGKSGSGKSTACRYLNANLDNVLYISVDNIVEENIKGNIIEKVNNELREKYNMGPYGRVEIIDSFYAEDDEHKFVYEIFKKHLVEDVRERIKYYKKTGKDIILDWFMLEVSDLFNDCDMKILLKAPMDLRKVRVINRGNFKAGFFERNEKSHNEKNERLYDYVIDTTKDWKSEINRIFNIKNPTDIVLKQRDTISVIIPVYNCERYIKNCLESLKHQTYRNLEIIIVNDGSTDSTLEICQKMQYDDCRIIIINQENKGVSAARNRGIEEATGKYIAFVDADDIIEPNMYEIMYYDMYLNTADVVRVGAYIHDRKGNIRHSYNDNSVFIVDSKKEIIHKYSTGELSVAVWDKLFTKKIIGDTRFKENVYQEDTIFVWDIFKKCNKIVNDKKQLYHYIKRSSCSLTSRVFNNDNFALQLFGREFYDYIISEYPENELDANLFYFNCLYFILKRYMRDFEYIKDNFDYRKRIKIIIREIDKILPLINKNNSLSEKNINNLENIKRKILI